MQNGDVFRVGQGAAGDQAGEGRLYVESVDVGVSEGGVEGASGLARLDLGQLVGSEPGPGEQSVPAAGLGDGGQGQVLGRQALHAFGVVVGSADHLVGGHVRALAAEHPGQRLPSGDRRGRAVVAGRRVGVVVGAHVQPVGLPAPGGRHVEHLAGGRGRDHGVRRVHRPPWCSMGGGGVGQLDVLGRICRR